MDRRYCDYDVLHRVAEERDQLALGLGVRLSRAGGDQRFCAAVNLYLERKRRFRTDPECIGEGGDQIVWPPLPEIQKELPETVVPFLEGCRAQINDGKVVEGKNLSPPEWAKLTAILNADGALWGSIRKKAHAYSTHRVDDVVQSVAQKLSMSILCNADKWFSDWRGDPTHYTNWRGAIYSLLTPNMFIRSLPREGGPPCGPLPREPAVLPTPSKSNFRLLDEARAALTEQESQVLSLKYSEGLSDREIAGRLRITAGRVRQLHLSALNKLRRLLE